jgi:hypothetical protein
VNSTKSRIYLFPFPALQQVISLLISGKANKFTCLV